MKQELMSLHLALTVHTLSFLTSFSCALIGLQPLKHASTHHYCVYSIDSLLLLTAVGLVRAHWPPLLLWATIPLTLKLSVGRTLEVQGHTQSTERQEEGRLRDEGWREEGKERKEENARWWRKKGEGGEQSERVEGQEKGVCVSVCWWNLPSSAASR